MWINEQRLTEVRLTATLEKWGMSTERSLQLMGMGVAGRPSWLARAGVEG